MSYAASDSLQAAVRSIPRAGIPLRPDASRSLTRQAEDRQAEQWSHSACADRETVRYALDHLQLRGTSGEIVATDGRQVLRQGGFSFPWTDDVLVPALGVFGCKELPQDEPVGIGRTDDRVVLRIEPWTLWLRVNKDGRFPKVDDIIPAVSNATSHLTWSESDAEFLVKSIPRLPCDDGSHSPVTIELNRRIAVRACGEGGTRPTELLLSSSSCTGEPLTINSNRRFLAHALKLGFRTFHFFGPNNPALCDDGRRQYLWALLEPESAIKAVAGAIQIASATEPATSTIPIKNRRAPKPMTSTNAPSTTEAPVTGKTRQRRRTVNPSPGSPIDQAIALRAALRDAASQANELIRSLKRQKKQTKLVASTLASLKELE